MKALILMVSVVAALAGPVAAPLAGQVDPHVRLTEVLPEDVASDVLRRIEDARDRGLPTRAMALVALEGVVKGRSGAEVVAAVESLAVDLGRAREVLSSAGQTPSGEDVEAAATAIRMGVDGAAVAEMVRARPSGRGLTVPMTVGSAPPSAAAMGLGLAGSMTGFSVPVAGTGTPVGPPVAGRGRPENRPTPPGRPGVPSGR